MTPEQAEAVLDGHRAASRIVDEWLEARAALAACERAEHPDLTDALGRRWEWKSRDLYRHAAVSTCEGICPNGAEHHVFAWPRDFLPGPVAEAVKVATDATG